MSLTTDDSARALGARYTPADLAGRMGRALAAAQPAAARILDPACGDGALLLAAAEACPEAEFFGIELDPARAHQARERMARDLPGPAGERAARHIRCADGLDPSERWPSASAVIANPPWVSLSGRQRATLAPERRHLYRASWSAARGSWPSLHGAFLERIAQHIGSYRTHAQVLLPSSVGQQVRYGSMRVAVTRWAKLQGAPLELGEDAFAGVVEPAFLIALAGRANEVAGSEAAWLWPALTCGDDRRVLDRLAPFPRLAPDAFRDPGVHTGNAAKELITALDPELPGVRVGRDLTPYRLAAPTRGIRVDLERNAQRRFRIGSLERYSGVPILLRQTGNRPIAALHRDPTYFRNSLLACTPPDALDPAFVVGVLNATVATAWHRLSFRDARQRAFPQVKVGHLRTQPFPIAARSDNRVLHDRVCRLVRAAGADPAAATAIEALVLEAFGLDAAARARIADVSSSGPA